MTGTKAFDGLFTAGWMRRFAETVAVTEEELTRLDQAAGDGDFGVNLLTGVRCALAALDRLPPGRQAAAVPLGAAAGAFLDEVGGTSGPLFGLVLQELAAAVGTGPLTGPALARGATAALEAVQRVGEARPGDKTLVDALHPAALALRGCTPDARPDDCLAAAAAAAAAGVRRTRALRARRGRASYLGERASGVPDPGAVGIALLFASAHAVPRTLGGVLRDDSAADRASTGSASTDTAPTDTASTDTAFGGPDPLCGPEPAPAGP